MADTNVESQVDFAVLKINNKEFSCRPTSALISSSYQEAGQPLTLICGEEKPASATVVKSLKIVAIQDFTDPAGLMRELRANELKTVPFELTLNPQAETATGQVQCRLGDWGGEARKRLTHEIELPISNLAWRDPITPTGATAGTPGTFTPAGAYTPANFAALSGITASPAAAWTGAQHVLLRDKSTAWWNGNAWTAGKAPTTRIKATGAKAGKPGTFTPTGAAAPANLAAMSGVTADPKTKWAAGEHVVLGDASKAHWDATNWAAGAATAEGGLADTEPGEQPAEPEPAEPEPAEPEPAEPAEPPDGDGDPAEGQAPSGA